MNPDDLPPPTPADDLFILRARLTDAALATMRRRNAQYATPERPIRNYELAAEIASTTPARVALARTAEKLVRMSQALDRGDLDTIDEEAREIMNIVAIIAYAARTTERGAK